MRTCPVCETECKTIICARCGFDGSRDYERWPTIATLDVSVDSVAERRKALRTLAACGNCGGTGFVIDAATGQVICGNCRTPWKPVTPAPEPAEEKVPAEEAVVDEISPFEPDEEPEKKPKRRLRTRGKLVLGAAAACLLIVLAVLLYHPWNGWFERFGKTYYYEDGHKADGFTQIGGDTYYFGYDGVMRTGRALIHGEYYYFSSDGVMQTGWQQPYPDLDYKSDAWCYYGDDGIQQHYWITVDGKTYWLDYYDGRVTGLQTIDGNVYYFDENGILQTDCSMTIDGVDYYFDENGVGRVVGD